VQASAQTYLEGAGVGEELEGDEEVLNEDDATRIAEQMKEQELARRARATYPRITCSATISHAQR